MDYTLLAIVDIAFVPEEEAEKAVVAAARGGATWIQVRAKGLASGLFLRYAREAGRGARRAGIPFLINDRIDLALATGADGVHLGEKDLPAGEAFRLLGPDAKVGITARDRESARKAERDGASYLGVGPQFASPTKPELTPLPEGRSEEIRRSTRLPLVGIGGIDESNAAVAGGRGLDGIAVLSALWRRGDPCGAAAELARAFRNGRGS